MDCSNKYQCIIFGHIGLSFFWPQFRPVGVPPGGFKTESTVEQIVSFSGSEMTFNAC